MPNAKEKLAAIAAQCASDPQKTAICKALQAVMDENPSEAEAITAAAQRIVSAGKSAGDKPTDERDGLRTRMGLSSQKSAITRTGRSVSFRVMDPASSRALLNLGGGELAITRHSRSRQRPRV